MLMRDIFHRLQFRNWYPLSFFPRILLPPSFLSDSWCVSSLFYLKWKVFIVSSFPFLTSSPSLLFSSPLISFLFHLILKDAKVLCGLAKRVSQIFALHLFPSLIFLSSHSIFPCCLHEHIHDFVFTSSPLINYPHSACNVCAVILLFS